MPKITKSIKDQIRMVQGNLPTNIDFRSMAKICRMKKKDFHSYGTKVQTPNGVYFYKDNGSDILAVAHLDSVQPFTHFDTVKMKNDRLIFSPVLDDRLGAWAILKYLPQIGINYDILLTDNEEIGADTGQYFSPPSGKEYKWMFSFDLEATGAKMYFYSSPEGREALTASGITYIANSRFSSICELDGLGCQGFNFGVGYHSYHSEAAYASKHELMSQLKKFVLFYKRNKDTHFKYVREYNVFNMHDGFSYDAKITKGNFTLDEYEQGLKLLEEAKAKKGQKRHNAFSANMDRNQFQNMLVWSANKEVPTEVEEVRGSEDRSYVMTRNKAGTSKHAIIQHIKSTPGDKPLLNKTKSVGVQDGQSTDLFAICKSCGNEYRITSTSSLESVCEKCEKESLVLKYQSQKHLPFTGKIKTKIPLNFKKEKGVLFLDYVCVKGVWTWKSEEVSKKSKSNRTFPVGFTAVSV